MVQLLVYTQRQLYDTVIVKKTSQFKMVVKLYGRLTKNSSSQKSDITCQHIAVYQSINQSEIA